MDLSARLNPLLSSILNNPFVYVGPYLTYHDAILVDISFTMFINKTKCVANVESCLLFRKYDASDDKRRLTNPYLRNITML